MNALLWDMSAVTLMEAPRMTVNNRSMLTDSERLRILDELDQVEARRSVSRRKFPRLEYRLRGVPAIIEHPNGSTARLLVPTRNISCGGLSILATCFLHMGTKVTVALPDHKGGHRACAGRVAFCRFICGRIHEIGIAFVEQVKLEEFCTPESGLTLPDEGQSPTTWTPLAGTVVVVSQRAVERVLIVSRLRQTGLIAVAVENTGAAMDRVKRIGASVIVCDMALGESATQSLVESVTTLCASLPVVGMVFPNDPEAVKAAVQCGMMGCLVAPLALIDVHEVMSRALRSGSGYVPADLDGASLANEGGSGAEPEMVRFFVAHCGEAATRLRGFVASADHAGAVELCRSLQSTAPGYGFRSIAFAAREALASLNATGSTEESSDRVGSLLNVLDRIAPEPVLSEAVAPGIPEHESGKAVEASQSLAG